METVGKSLIFLGILLIIVGSIFLISPKISFLNWFGNLPGDIKIEKENFRFYFPFLSCIILSIFISLVFFILKKLG